MTRAITVLFVLLLVSNAQPVSAQSNKKQPGPQIPDVNRLLKGVQGKVKRIEDDVKRSPPSTRGEQPQPQRPPTPAPRVPEIPKPQQEQPVPPPRPTASAKNNGQQRPPLQADMLLVDKPVDGLPGGAFVAFSPSGKLLLTSNGKGVAKLCAKSQTL